MKLMKNKNKDIEELQKLLTKIGYNYVQITGKWDKNTECGIREFQRDNNLISENDYQKYINESTKA